MPLPFLGLGVRVEYLQVARLDPEDPEVLEDPLVPKGSQIRMSVSKWLMFFNMPSKSVLSKQALNNPVKMMNRY